MAGFQLFFFFIIIHDSVDYSLMPWRYQYNIRKKKWTVIDDAIDGEGEPADNNRRSIPFSKLWGHVALIRIDAVAERVKSFAKRTLDEDDPVSQVGQKCKERVESNNENIEPLIINEDFLVGKFNQLKREDAHLLLEELRATHQCQDITLEAFCKWMVESHQNCVSLGQTLTDALAAVTVLDRVLTGFICAFVILSWLKVTGLATITVIAIIASPFLALSFFFSEACKTLFQGVVFTFVVRPFDVGDRCIVDGIEVGVKKVGILTTTFFNIETKEILLYPNSDLSTKHIIKLEHKPDATDAIELVLDSSTDEDKLDHLQERINVVFQWNAEDGVYAKQSNDMKVKKMKTGIKMTIKFTHAINIDEVSHSECLRIKDRQRSEFLQEIQHFLQELDIKVGKSYKFTYEETPDREFNV